MRGVLFGDKHSYRDWGLVLASRPTISPPSPKTILVDIPGSDGKIDLTESLTGEVAYNNREISCSFSVVDKRENWANKYSEILDYLHGKRMKIVFDEDEEYYYYGRIEIDSWESDIASATLNIKADVEPFKLEQFSSLDDWDWDPFDFETGIAREYKDIRVDRRLDCIVEGRRKPVSPVFIAEPDENKNLYVIYHGKKYLIHPGRSRILNIVLKQGTNTLTFVGYGKVSIDYRGGGL